MKGRASGLLLFAAVATACSDLSFTTPVNTITTPILHPSWSYDIAPIIGQTCATSYACHGGPNPGGNGMNLEPLNSRLSIVNVPTVAMPQLGLLRVNPGKPDSSFFYLVTSTVDSVRHGYYRMPLTEHPLPEPVRQTIRNWIADGALNN